MATLGAHLNLSLQVVGGDEIDSTDADDMSRALESELEVQGFVRDIEEIRSPSRPGAKGFDLALLLKILPDAIPSAIGYIQEWALRPGNRPVKVKAQGPRGSLEVEFDPRTMSTDSVKAFVLDLQALVQE